MCVCEKVWFCQALEAILNKHHTVVCPWPVVVLNIQQPGPVPRTTTRALGTNGSDRKLSCDFLASLGPGAEAWTMVEQGDETFRHLLGATATPPPWCVQLGPGARPSPECRVFASARKGEEKLRANQKKNTLCKATVRYLQTGGRGWWKSPSPGSISGLESWCADSRRRPKHPSSGCQFRFRISGRHCSLRICTGGSKGQARKKGERGVRSGCLVLR